MAKELASGLDRFLGDGRGGNFASWVALILPEIKGSDTAPATGRAFYLATSALTIDGVNYKDSLREVGQIKRGVSRAAEQITITIENVTTVYGATLLKDIDALHGATVRAGRYWQDPVSGSSWSEQMFTGVVDGVSGDEQSVILRCLSDYYAVRAVGGGRAVELQCQAVFNSPAVRAVSSTLGQACGYTGTDTTCDKLKATCAAKGNLHRFQGVVNIDAAAPTTNTANLTVPNYSLIQDGTGASLGPAPVVKFTGATGSTSGGVTTLTLSGSTSLEGYYVDAAPYSAAGNGTTDDTSAIQAAIDAAYTAGGGIVYLGAKTYKCSALVLKDKVWIAGAHWRKSVLYSTTNARILYVSTTATDAGVTNLTIKGGVSVGSNQKGLEVAGSGQYWGFTARDIWIEDCGGRGFQMGDGTNNGPFSVTLDNIHVSNCAGYPFVFDTTIAPCITLRNSYAHTLRSGAGVGFRIRSGFVRLENCNGIDNAPALTGSKWAVVGKKNGVDGDSTDASAAVALVNCNVESFDTHGIHLYHGSRVDVLGRTTFAGGGNANQVGIEYDQANDGTDYYSQYITAGYIEDTVDFGDGASAYKNSQPIHAKNCPPLQLIGTGPNLGNTSAAPLSTFYNTTASAAQKLRRVDGRVSAQVVTGTLTISQPGVRYIELNHTGTMTLTLPWPGWYFRAQEPIIIKDRSASGCATYNVTVNTSGGSTVNGASSLTMDKTGQAVILLPDGSGDWRVVADYPSVAGTGTSSRLAYWNGTLSLTSSSGLEYDSGNTALKAAKFWASDRHGWSGDTDTYIDNPGANEIGFNVGGSQKAWLTSGNFNVAVNLRALTDATYDVGVSGNAFRDAWLTRDAHIGREIHAGGSAPSSSTGTGAGTSPTFSVDGTAICGAILLTTGTSPAANAKIWDITMPAAFANYPVPVLFPANAAAATALADGRIFVDDSLATSTKWTVKSTGTALTASTDYIFYYQVMGF